MVKAITRTCVTIESCEDQKAPFTLPGECCQTCGECSAWFLCSSAHSSRVFLPSEYLASMRAFITSSPQEQKRDTWNEWTDWTRCSRDCGRGRQSRMRDCSTVNKAFINCTGERVQVQDCNTHECPSKFPLHHHHALCHHAPLCNAVDGGWTRWSEWNQCSTTCGNGTQTRNRSCTDPIPQYGGEDCSGDTIETKRCHLRHCPGEQPYSMVSSQTSSPSSLVSAVDCVWEAWSNWTECNVACGGGQQSRSRSKQVEKYGGRACEGLAVESIDCNTHHCPSESYFTCKFYAL